MSLTGSLVGMGYARLTMVFHDEYATYCMISTQLKLQLVNNVPCRKEFANNAHMQTNPFMMFLYIQYTLIDSFKKVPNIMIHPPKIL
eukprot:4111015-Pleurochrysis_carterae.AAC.2